MNIEKYWGLAPAGRLEMGRAGIITEAAKDLVIRLTIRMDRLFTD